MDTFVKAVDDPKYSFRAARKRIHQYIFRDTMHTYS